MVTPCFAPVLDPQSVVRLQHGRLPAPWRSRGQCSQCGRARFAANTDLRERLETIKITRTRRD